MDTPTAVPAGQSTQQAMMASGGQVVLNSSDGAVFTLSVPAGALPVGTVLTLSTATATTAQHFQLRLAPLGAVLASGQQATLTVLLPASDAVPAAGGLLYDGVPVPFTRLADGRLQVMLASFGSGTGGTVAAAERKWPLSVQVQTNTTGTVCAPQLGGADGSLTAADAIEVELYGQCMVAAVNALASNGQFADAVRVASATAGYLQAAGLGDPGGFVRQATSITCIAYRAALDHAIDTPVTTNLSVLFDISRPIMFWEMTLQKLGGSCSNVGVTEYQTVINDKTSQAIAYFATKKAAITNTSGTEYTEAVAAAQSSRDTAQQVRSLQPAPAVAQVLATQIEQRAQPALVDAMLQAPWQRCRDSGHLDELLRLIDVMGPSAAITAAAQYCGTQLSAQARNAGGDVLAGTTTLGGISADQKVTAGTIAVPRDGTLLLSGALNALECPVSHSGGTEVLLVKIDGVTVQTLSTAPYLQPTLTLGMPSALAAAGVSRTASSARLTLERTGVPCDGIWGDNPAPLLALTLSMAPPLVISNATYGNPCSNGPAVFPLNMACGGLNAQIRVQAIDAGTITVASDLVVTSSGSFVVDFDVTFPVAGTVTLTPSLTWIDSMTCAGGFTVQDVLQAYVEPARQPAFNPGTVGTTRCYAASEYPASSFEVAAGASILFQFVQTSTDSLSGHGTAFTIQFVPAH